MASERQIAANRRNARKNAPVPDQGPVGNGLTATPTAMA